VRHERQSDLSERHRERLRGGYKEGLREGYKEGLGEEYKEGHREGSRYEVITTYLDDIPPPVMDDGDMAAPGGISRISDRNTRDNGDESSLHSATCDMMSSHGGPEKQTLAPVRQLGKHVAIRCQELMKLYWISILTF